MRTVILTAALAGCGLGSSGDGSALEVVIGGDADDLARQVSESTRDLPGGEISVQGEVEGVGDCMWDWSVAGPREGAALGASPRSTPCGLSGAGDRFTWVYEVTAGSLSGTVADIGAGRWSFDLTGQRSAEITVDDIDSESSEEGGRLQRRDEDREPQTYDASLDLLSLVGETDGESPSFDAEASYVGWLDGSWSLVWSVAEDQSVSGTATGPRGKTCLIGGIRGDVEVSCDP